MHPIKSRPGLHICQDWELLVYLLRGLWHLVNTLTSIESIIKLVALTNLTSRQEKSPSCVQQGFHLYHHQEMLESGTSHDLTSEWSARKLTIKIIHSSVSKSTPFYVHTFQKVTYYKPVLPPIQYRLVEKIDSVS